ncbi:Protein CBG24811 [Caenorhabditis briggsae]|uniref:Protein CBG24811 n=1 Tax=Caenorhabditis briggsae TaxID=6238 RepID=A8WLJ5_CAEBR|nr:Protein CBG24811 [Caenorhabditis briggsae]CAP21340.1 Protein CBG24811 [Caenorhabditis briggsae]
MTDREFTLKHVFNDVGKLENGQNLYSPKEEHFGVDWRINMETDDNHLGIFLIQYSAINQEIGVDCSMKIVSKNKEKTCSMSISLKKEQNCNHMLLTNQSHPKV